jgi:small subunit ribosomal protein S19
MARSQWKGPYSRVTVTRRDQRIQDRASTILPEHVDARVLIHNGKRYLPLTITQEMVGHRFGEFARTRLQTKHKLQKKKTARRR